MPTTKSTLFVVSKDEWGTKEDPGKSMKNALYVQWAPFRLKQHRIAKKIKPAALAIVELCKSEGRQGEFISQLIENSVKYIFLKSITML